MGKLSRILALFPLLALSLFGQEYRATVTGHAIDPTGAVMPNVSVQITNTGTNEVSRTVTNAQGIYIIPSLKPGVYRLSAEAAGFTRVRPRKDHP